MVLSAMCALRAFSLPFCMAGTSAAARAHSTQMPAPAQRWGPGKSLPVRRKVLTGPATDMRTPSPRIKEPQLLCFSFSFWPISSLRSCGGGGAGGERGGG
jgi:hypothetical protein